MDIQDLMEKAKGGNTAAQSILGISYLSGHEIATDYEQAFHWLSLAAAKGASRAIVNLADMYASGLWVERDISKAIELYESVARSEFFAAIALGRIYSVNNYVPAEPDKAREWYSVAAGFKGGIVDCDELREAKQYLKRENPGGRARNLF